MQGRGRGPPPGRGPAPAGGRGAPPTGAAPARPAPQAVVPGGGTAPPPSRMPVMFKALAGYPVEVTVRATIARSGDHRLESFWRIGQPFYFPSTVRSWCRSYPASGITSNDRRCAALRSGRVLVQFVDRRSAVVYLHHLVHGQDAIRPRLFSQSRIWLRCCSRLGAHGPANCCLSLYAARPQVKAGSVYSGVFSSAVSDKGQLALVLKVVHQRAKGASAEDPPTARPQAVVTLAAKDVVQVSASDCTLWEEVSQ